MEGWGRFEPETASYLGTMTCTNNQHSLELFMEGEPTRQNGQDTHKWDGHPTVIPPEGGKKTKQPKPKRTKAKNTRSFQLKQKYILTCRKFTSTSPNWPP